MSYPLVRLDECARIVGGATPSTSKDEFWDGEILRATPADLSKLDGPFISRTPRTITATGLASCAAELLPRNSVLFSSRAPIGHVAINTAPMATNQGFKSFVPAPDQARCSLPLSLAAGQSAVPEELGTGRRCTEVSKAVVSELKSPFRPSTSSGGSRRSSTRPTTCVVSGGRHFENWHDFLVLTFLSPFGDPEVNPSGFIKRPIHELLSEPPNFGSMIPPSESIARGCLCG